MTRHTPFIIALSLVLPAASQGCKRYGEAPAGHADNRASATAASTPKAPANATPKAKPKPKAVTKPAQATPLALKANEPPSFELPAYTRVGVGQEVGFGLEVVDLESDWFKVDLVGKPKSASFDPYTLTVTFTPTKADMPEAHFTVRITETLRNPDGTRGKTRAANHHFAIAVSADKQPKPRAQPLGPAVEQLLTIHDPERLAEANKRWPLEKLLVLNAELAKRDLPKQQRDSAKIDPKRLYKDFLKATALAHKNPELDPDSERFDAKTWADPSHWEMIAVRARLDKSWHEVRLVMRAKAHAATYTMFKFRPIAARKGLPVDARGYNNKEFGRLVLKAFFDGAKLNPKHTVDKKAHAKATADFLDSVLLYKSPDVATKPWAVNSVHALPCEARLGGGTFRDASGEIAGGDAWGWHVQKPKYVADKDGKSGRMKFVNIPIKGFLTDVSPNADGTAWEMACGEVFDEGHQGFNPDRKGLCRPSGHTDLPGGGDGYEDTPNTGSARSAFVDAAHLFWDHKNVDMVKTVPLRDPRRDLFEEKGMSCHQCHVRKFGVRDMADEAAWNPKAGMPKGLNKSMATLYFVITPTTHWQAYAVDFQHKQECKAKKNLATFTGVETDLTCPLTAEL